jgi:hypothetical protein
MIFPKFHIVWMKKSFFRCHHGAAASSQKWISKVFSSSSSKKMFQRMGWEQCAAPTWSSWSFSARRLLLLFNTCYFMNFEHWAPLLQIQALKWSMKRFPTLDFKTKQMRKIPSSRTTPCKSKQKHKFGTVLLQMNKFVELLILGRIFFRRPGQTHGDALRVRKIPRSCFLVWVSC